jgi:hypothetical protein
LTTFLILPTTNLHHIFLLNNQNEQVLSLSFYFFDCDCCCACQLPAPYRSARAAGFKQAKAEIARGRRRR